MTGPYMGGKYERGSEDLKVPRVGDRLRRFWDFDDLELSEERFLAQLEHETSDEGRAEVLTQLARLHGLHEQFSEGERLITEAEALAGASVIAGIRIQLERGRLRRSSGDVAGALPLFESAYVIAVRAGEQFLAVDAAHMAMLAAPDRHGKLAWTQRGIDIAAASTDRQVAYWVGPLLNNLGCEYQDAGEYEAALDAFQRALEVRMRYPENPAAIAHAHEAVAEALRALGRADEELR
jgi:tetratricopeptide (TPR) repeat protein